jgi:hypothetical protein
MASRNLTRRLNSARNGDNAAVRARIPINMIERHRVHGPGACKARRVRRLSTYAGRPHAQRHQP